MSIHNANKTLRTIGLTGGIGSGKTTVCRLLSEHGFPIIDADEIARQIVEPGSPGLQSVIHLFGEQYLRKDGHLNRTKLRDCIFKDPQQKKMLEALLHPLIHQQILKQIEFYRKGKNGQACPKWVFVVIPLLVENIKNEQKPDYLDEIWVVDCSEEDQIKRASQRDDQTREQIIAIINQQASRAQRLKWADRIIHNNGDLIDLENQISSLLEKA